MRKSAGKVVAVLWAAAAAGCAVDAEDRGYTKAPLETTGLWTTTERGVQGAGEPIRQVPFEMIQQQPGAQPTAQPESAPGAAPAGTAAAPASQTGAEAPQPAAPPTPR
jgi:hypothetical protein